MNNIELVRFAESKIGTAYVYGMKGTVMTQADYDRLKNDYGSMVWDSDRNKIGQVCVDCSGLISWATGITRSSQGYHDVVEKESEYTNKQMIFPISTIKDAPIGVAVWQNGHIGIYTGSGTYIAADGSAYGVRRNSLSKASFTHWFKIVDVEYIKEGDEEVVEKSKMVVEGQEISIDRILKNGRKAILGFIIMLFL